MSTKYNAAEMESKLVGVGQAHRLNADRRHKEDVSHFLLDRWDNVIQPLSLQLLYYYHCRDGT